MPPPPLAMVVHLPSNCTTRLTRNNRLRPGAPAAPRRDSLPLLPPGPDGVQRLLPRRTQSSTPLEPSSIKRNNPQGGIRPRYGGLRVQGTASSPSSTTTVMLPQARRNVKSLHEGVECDSSAPNSREQPPPRKAERAPTPAILPVTFGSFTELDAQKRSAILPEGSCVIQ